ncbi:MAG: DUF1015 domain-containing protein [Spirochaetales bacterium]|nr:DUF1015 domain-containing protein [Spirochaetales bacterium]
MDNNINDVRPFCAYHYNPMKIGDIGACLSQPYDVISPAQQEKYYRRHENNIIRLILGKSETADNALSNQYTRARDYLKTWCDQNILHKTARDSFWVYEQEFRINDGGPRKVKGFIGKVRLYDYEEMRILPHEKVLRDALLDRIRLTETTNTQFEYIWGMYQDKGFVVDNILDECSKESGIIDYIEPDTSVRHRLWRLVDPGMCERIQATLSGCRIYIADGHHRYQTMLHIRNEFRRKYPDAGPDAPWEFIMMFLVNTSHEGLTILPTHRAVHHLSIGNWDTVMSDVSHHFHVREYRWENRNEKEVRKTWLDRIKTENEEEHQFGLYLGGRECYYLLTLKDSEAYEELVDLDQSSAWKRLDVNIVNYLLFKQLLGISEEQLAANTNVRYIVDPNEAVESVAEGRNQAAVILNATKLSDVIAISDNKEVMPRKSTFFYPKPVSGLVMYSIDQH